MAIGNEALVSGGVARRQPPTEYVTENGFSIIRRSEVERSGTDTAHQCQFLVSNPNGWEREVTVEFDDSVIALAETRRRRPLSLNSGFWIACAERCLANYLWENDGYPPGGQLTVSELCIDEVLLAAHWRD